MLNLLLWTALAHAAPAVMEIEPVLEWAEADLRAARVSRLAVVAALTAPGLLYVGGIGARSFEGPEQTAGVTLAVVGAAGAIAAPPLLFYGASRSRAALRGQGLALGPARTWVAVPLWLASIGTIGTIGIVNGGDFTSSKAGVVVGLSSYVASVALGATDLQANHAARQRAGWLGIVPRDRGIAVAGSW